MSLWNLLFPKGIPPYVLVTTDPVIFADRPGPEAHDDDEDDAEAALCGHCKLPADDCRCD